MIASARRPAGCRHTEPGADVFDDEARVDLRLALLVARQRPQRQAELAAVRDVAGIGDLVDASGARPSLASIVRSAWSRQTLSLTRSPGADMPIRLDSEPERRPARR